MAGDLAVALERVHVAHVDAAAGDLDRADEDRAGADGVDVHVAVGLVLLQLGRASIAKRCGAPTRNEPKSPALWESGIVADGEVPSWPMNGRSRVASATMSCGANVRIGFWTEPSGQGGVARGVVRDRLGGLAADASRRPSACRRRRSCSRW